MKKPKKTTKKQLKNKLWKLVSLYVRSKSPYCYTCGKFIPEMKNRHAGHFWSKGGHEATRFDLENVRTQCVNCNLFQSGYLAMFSVKLLQEIGEQRFMKLKRRANTSVKWDTLELEKEIEKMKLLTTNF